MFSRAHSWHHRLRRAGLLVPAFSFFLLTVPGTGFGQSPKFDNFVETSPRAGDPAPDFTLPTLDGDPFHLMEVAAETPVVMEFGSFT